MNCYIIGGATRQGKSRYTKAMITQPNTIRRPCLVYDYQNEYGAFYNTLINGKIVKVPGPGLPLYKPGLMRSRFCGKFEDFLKIVCEKKGTQRVLHGFNIIFEEATIFLKGGMNEGIRDLVVSRFHDQNNLIFVFHKLQTCPPDIMDLTNYVVLFKTADKFKMLEKRFEDTLITDAFNLQRLKPDGAKPTIIGKYSRTLNGKPYKDV